MACGCTSVSLAASHRMGALLALKLWPGFRHEWHTDPELEQVFELMLAWLGQQLEKAPTSHDAASL